MFAYGGLQVLLRAEEEGNLSVYLYLRDKDRGKVDPRTGHEDPPEGE
jgi:hypothetical protein